MRMPMKNRNLSFPKAALITVLLLVSALSGQGQSDESRSGQWRIAGQNLSNSWSQPTEHSISPSNVKGLSPEMGVHNGWGCVCYSDRGWRRSLLPRLGRQSFRSRQEQRPAYLVAQDFRLRRRRWSYLSR